VKSIDLKVMFKVEVKAMSNGSIEVISGKERRRRWSMEEKLRIVAESQEPGTCVKAVAARHDVYPSLVFTWRRQVREGRLDASEAAGFVPVRLLRLEQERKPLQPDDTVHEAGVVAGIDITLPDGSRIHIRDAGQLPLLRPVIVALRG
jgi:transposase